MAFSDWITSEVYGKWRPYRRRNTPNDALPIIFSDDIKIQTELCFLDFVTSVLPIYTSPIPSQPILQNYKACMAKSIIKGKKKYTVKNLYKGWCPQTGSKQWLERINAECISPRQFYNRYVRRRMPVILTASNIECLKAFSLEALTGISGDCRVAVERADQDSYQPFGRTDASSRRNMKFSDFLERMREEELYCSTQPLREDKHGPTSLTSDHVQRFIDRGMIPERLPLMGNLTPYQINTWIGCSADGSSSGYHHDFHDNFYLLLSGEKQFRIASPNFTETKPTYGCQGNKHVLVHQNGLISYTGDSIREDGARLTDVLKWKISKNPDNVEELREQLEERVLEEMMDSVDGLREGEFPPSFCTESTAHGEYITETLKAGEMLYLPASFFHEVISFNTDDNTHHMAVNYWYYPPASTGTFETPYEDDYWVERWQRVCDKQAKRVRVNRDRMRRHKLPLQFQYSKKEIMRFIQRIEKYKRAQ